MTKANLKAIEKYNTQYVNTSLGQSLAECAIHDPQEVVRITKALIKIQDKVYAMIAKANLPLDAIQGISLSLKEQFRVQEGFTCEQPALKAVPSDEANW